MEALCRHAIVALLFAVYVLGAEAATAAPAGDWVDLCWIELAGEGEFDPVPQMAAFPAVELPEPLRRLVMVLALAGIAFSLRRL
jgi:hypothetical protein